MLGWGIFTLLGLGFIWGDFQTSAEVVILDMSYAYIENHTFYYGGHSAFKRHYFPESGWWTVNKKRFWMEWYAFFTSEHGGTHIDAPRHCDPNGWALDEIPLKRLLYVPLAVLNVTKQAEKDPDYLATTADFQVWERQHGKLEEGSAVFLYTGRGQYWDIDWAAFVGTPPDHVYNDSQYHWPGFHQDLVDWLGESRGVIALGTDTPSIDKGQTLDFPAHQIFAKRKMWAAEMVANLDKAPPVGSRVSVHPIKMKGGTGGPSRIYATWDNDPSSGQVLTTQIVILYTSCYLLLF